MNKRSRVQYGKVSKRVSSRTTVQITSISVEETEVVSAPPKPVPSAAPKPQKITRIDSESSNYKDAEPKAKPTRLATRAHTDTVLQDSKSRKRKRDLSPASSEPTDVTDEDEPMPAAKAVKRDSANRTAKKVPAASSSKLTPTLEKTPSHPSTPNEPVIHTPKLARDLSDLFISVSKPVTPGGSPQRPGHLKRMLSKAKTESALESSLATPGPSLFPSRSIATPSSSPQKDSDYTPLGFSRKSFTQDRTPSPPRRAPSPPPIPRSPQKLARTYSKSRSFLVEVKPESESMDIDSLRASPSSKHRLPDMDIGIQRDSVSELRSRWGLHESEQDPELNTPINDLNSMGEMRSRGETRRFLDEVGYLLEGLDGSNGRVNTAAKRASAIEIVSKMGDSEFFRRAVAADFVGKAWVALRSAGAGSGEDKLLDAALVALAAMATKDPRQAMELVKTRDFVSFLSMSVGIQSDQDVLVPPPTGEELIWMRKQGLAKSDRTNLSILRSSIEKARIINSGSMASQRLLASESLSRFTDLGISVGRDTVDALIDSMVAELSDLPAASSVSFEEKSLNLRHLKSCLKVVAPCSAKETTKTSEQKEAEGKLTSLLAKYVNIWPAHLQSEATPAAMDSTVDITLRHLVTTSHDDEIMCEALASSEDFVHNLLRLFLRWYRNYFEGFWTRGDFISKTDEDEDDEDKDQAQTLERVSLSLGLVIQLVKNCDTAKIILRETKLSPTCPVTRACVERCHCKKQVPGVRALAEVYNQSHDGLNAAAESQADFIRGNIGILLGMLCVHDDTGRKEVLHQLEPIKGSDSDKLRALIEVLRDFSALLSEVVQKVGKDDEDDSETRSAANVVEKNIETGKLDDGVKLASDVVQKLESLL